MQTIQTMTGSRYKTFIIIVMLIGICTNLILTLYNHKESYLSTNFWSRYHAMKNAYLQSQYVKRKSNTWISDYIINTYTAAEYIKGTSPVLIAPDTPPMGRYLIGVSILLFNNENIVVLLFTMGALGFMYALGVQILDDKLLALLPVFLLSFEPLFLNQIAYVPQLDTMQLCFILAAFYFFNKGLLSKKKELIYFAAANLSLGLFVSTKFFITGVLVIIAWFTVHLFHFNKRKMLSLVVTIPISVAVLLLSYIRVLFNGYPLSKFLGIQKYVFLYHKSQLILPLSIWPLLFLNRQYTWWGTKPFIPDQQWLITWPIITTLTIATAILYIFKTIPHRQEVEVLIVWVFLYLGFFSVGQISSRYFIILIPVLYIISVFGLYETYKVVVKKYKLKSLSPTLNNKAQTGRSHPRPFKTKSS